MNSTSLVERTVSRCMGMCTAGTGMTDIMVQARCECGGGVWMRGQGESSRWGSVSGRGDTHEAARCWTGVNSKVRGGASPRCSLRGEFRGSRQGMCTEAIGRPGHVLGRKNTPAGVAAHSHGMFSAVTRPPAGRSSPETETALPGHLVQHPDVGCSSQSLYATDGEEGKIHRLWIDLSQLCR